MLPEKSVVTAVAIVVIANDGMVHVGAVFADLVLTPRLGHRFDERVARRLVGTDSKWQLCCRFAHKGRDRFDRFVRIRRTVGMVDGARFR